MVYKKIGDKIPSLSSLLLAGVLLGSSCPSKSKSDAGADQKRNLPEEDTAGASGETEAGGVKKAVFDPAAHEAALRMLKVFIRAGELDFLGIGGLPVVLLERDLRKEPGQGAKVVEALKKACQQFSTLEAYRSLRGYVSDLSLLKFRTGGSGSGLSNKYAYGQALSAISEPMRALCKAYREVEKKLNDKAPLEDFTLLAKESLQPLLLSLDIKNTKLKNATQFFTSKEAKLPTGVRLAKFLTGLDVPGSFGLSDCKVPNLLRKIISTDGIWIKNKPANQGGRSAIDCLHERNVDIDAWTVSGSDITMPKIQKIPDDTLNKKYAPVQLIGGNLSESSVEMLGSQLVGCCGVSKPRSISFGTLLFALFRGEESPLDFFVVQRSGSPNSGRGQVSLVGNNERFQDLIRAAESESGFACALGEHLSCFVPDIFIVPDVHDCIDFILTSDIMQSLGTDSGQLVVDPTEDSQQLNERKVNGFKSGSLMDQVYKIIYEKCSLDLPSLSETSVTSSTILERITNLGKFSDHTALDHQDVEQVNFTFHQRICFELARDLSSDDFFQHVSKMTVPALIRRIRSKIKEVINCAIITWDNGKYEPTRVTELLRHEIRSLNEVLKQRHKQASVNYKNLQDEVKRYNPNLKFDIESIRAVIEGHCKDLNNILTVQVGPVLGSERDITSDTFPDIKGLLQSNLEELNEIKKQYQEQTRKSTAAPGA